MSSCKYCPNNANCTKSFCIQKFKKSKFFDFALLSKSQRLHIGLHPDADGTDREEFKKLKDIQDNIYNFINEGKNLYLYSKNPGCGKTSWALRFIQAYIDHIWYDSPLECKCLFINVPKFFLELKENLYSDTPNEYITNIKENVAKCDLVVWDEIGTKMLTDFEHEHLLSLINSRIDSNLSNIYTSNLFPEQLKEKVGDRLYSRVFNNSICIKLNGQDKRGVVNDSASST